MCGIAGHVGIGPQDLDPFINQLCRVNHRGHEAAGFAYTDGKELPNVYRNYGMVREACNADKGSFRAACAEIQRIGAFAYLGQTRYSTVGPSNLDLGQPMELVSPNFGKFYLAHNGQIETHEALRRECENKGHCFRTESDTETIMAWMAKLDVSNLVECAEQLLRKVPGTYSMLLMNDKYMIGIRDRFGRRPLVYQENDDLTVSLASEVSGLPYGGPDACILSPGSMIIVELATRKMEVRRIVDPVYSPCIFCQLYFSRPSQLIDEDHTTYEMRVALGKKLGEVCPVNVDCVCGVPTSGLAAAYGFHRRCKPGTKFYLEGIERNFYNVQSRSFILPGQASRVNAAQRKYLASRILRGKRVVIVDDTIVRLTTMPELVRMVRRMGATEVHVRVAASPVKKTCNRGIDIPTLEQLPASSHSETELCQMCGADSLRYLPSDSMMEVAHEFAPHWCASCFNHAG